MAHALGNNFGKLYSFQSKPVILDLQFTVSSTDSGGLGVTNITGQGVQNVFMHTSSTAGRGKNGYLNPNPATGTALIQLSYNYARMYCPSYSITSPLTGSALAINSTALTAHAPYQITAIGHGPAGVATIAPVADVAGSLTGKWFQLFDAYGNTFIIWFSVSGLGSAPVGVSGTLVQQTISTGATAATIGTALATTIAGLPSGVAGVFSFTTSGTTTVTVTSTSNLPLSGVPADGTAPTGFTFALTGFGTNNNAWAQVGLMPGVLPQVGAGFIATSTGYATGGGSTGTVQAVGVSGNFSMEVLAQPNTTIGPVPVGGSANAGGWFLVQFISPTSSSVTTPLATNPADTSMVRMTILLEQAARVGGNNE